jgi:hypothetical protein
MVEEHDLWLNQRQRFRYAKRSKHDLLSQPASAVSIRQMVENDFNTQPASAVSCAKWSKARPFGYSASVGGFDTQMVEGTTFWLLNNVGGFDTPNGPEHDRGYSTSVGGFDRQTVDTTCWLLNQRRR